MARRDASAIRTSGTIKAPARSFDVEVPMRFATALVVIWLLIGVVAAVQRDYFSGSAANCAKAGTILATIAAGPLNYVGVNPKIKCELPQPST
jgi:hypothetical protein